MGDPLADIARENIRLLLVSNGHTKAAFARRYAEEFGVHEQTIADRLRFSDRKSSRPLPVEFVEKVAGVLGVSPVVLMVPWKHWRLPPSGPGEIVFRRRIVLPVPPGVAEESWPPDPAEWLASLGDDPADYKYVAFADVAP